MSVTETIILSNEPDKDDLKLQELLKSQFAALARLVKRDLNDNKQVEYSFYKNFDRDKVQQWLAKPQRFEKELRQVVRFLFISSSHFRRAVLYFATLPMFKYTVEMYGTTDFKDLDIDIVRKKYIETVNYLEIMNLEHELSKVSLICWLEDTFFGYEYKTKDSYFIQPLDPDYCQISSIEDGVLNFQYDFSYFNRREEELDRFAPEFNEKYELYKSNKKKYRWQELDSDKTICIKINDNFDYSVPPLSGILESLYDIEDFKQLKKAKTELDNYLILALSIPYQKDKNTENQFALSIDKAIEFYELAIAQLPDQVGALLSPYEKVDAIRVDKSERTIDTVAEAERAFYNDAGISQLLFSSQDATGAALTKSVVVDEMLVFKFLKQCERWVNRKLKNFNKRMLFKTHFLEITHMNKREYIESAKEAASLGVPIKMRYATALGLTPSAMLNNEFVENVVFNIPEKWTPLKTSYTQSDKKSGNPGVDEEDLTDGGQDAIDRDTNNPDNRN